MIEAKDESYRYFDQHIRRLPKNADGSIDTLAPGFVDNDVDAFRHAYVSGVFTQEYGEKAANIFGWLNEFSSLASPVGAANMDLWNNQVGRRLGLQTRKRIRLAELVKKALESGKLITRLYDKRKFIGEIPPMPDGERSVVVLKRDKNGVNELFFDFGSMKGLKRSEFVGAIKGGKFNGYGVRKLRGREYPFAKKDSDQKNNLG